jgi:DNA-binding NtrC family response regulator
LRAQEHADGHREALRILVVEDDLDIAESVADALRDNGHRPTVVHDGDRALQRMAESAYDVLICDVRLPGADGLTIFREAKRERPDMPVILMSAYGSISEAVEALKCDAAHYLGKPFHMADLVAAVDEAAQCVDTAKRSRSARDRMQRSGTGEEIIGDSTAMVALREFVRTVAVAEGPVLVTGETGTGKELVAHTLHRLSRRADGPFVAINCAAFPETLLEAELFGHERGAFTGAAQKREGRFRAADRGTLFLDEVGDIAGGAQAKLLRVLETGAFQPLGSDDTVRVDVRIVSATNVDLLEGAGNRFRRDLYYRLKMFHVQVPSLRDRRPDLPLLVEHFLWLARPDDPPMLTPRAWAALTHYDYPGNVRELRNAVGHALAVARGGEIDVKHLPREFRGADGQDSATRPAVQSLDEAEREFERDYLVRTLYAASWNKTRAAAILGISRKTLWKKLRDLGVEG